MPGEGYFNTGGKVWPIGKQLQIVGCFEFRLIEAFILHRHTGKGFAAMRYP